MPRVLTGNGVGIYRIGSRNCGVFGRTINISAEMLELKSNLQRLQKIFDNSRERSSAAVLIS